LTACLLIGILVNFQFLSRTALGVRVQSMIASLQEGRMLFTEAQLKSAVDNFRVWFPFGAGTGLGYTVDYRQEFEIHNGHLAILVELGVFGFIAFYVFVAAAVFRNWKVLGSMSSWYRAIWLSFLLSGMVYMFHNPMDRNRQYMMFLGLVACPTIYLA